MLVSRRVVELTTRYWQRFDDLNLVGEIYAPQVESFLQACNRI